MTEIPVLPSRRAERGAAWEKAPLFSLLLLLLVTDVSPLLHFPIVLAGLALTTMRAYHPRLAY